MSNPPVKTSGDWMSLFTGSRYSGREAAQEAPARRYEAPSSRYTSSGYDSTTSSRYSDSAPSSRYSDSAISSRYSSISSRYSSPSSEYESGRRSPTTPSYSSTSYSPASYSSRTSVASPTLGRSSASISSRYPSYSRWTDTYREDIEEEEKREREGGGGGGGRGSKQVVLNEGTVVIRREGAVINTSDEESEEEEEEVKEEVKEPTPPPARDPLELEEEQLEEKLQTASFFLSMPEEEAIRKRILEIRQMRENPEMFLPENTKNYKFTQVSSGVARTSLAKQEEEKILLLRLSSRGLADVEQTDLQVRLQEIWRDRREEVSVGLGRVEQHYEHLLNESSTEISELEGSIELKYGAIAKLQEEMMILHMRKDMITADIEQVNTAHQAKLEELRAEINEIEKKSSEHCVVRSKPDPLKESSLPEDERSEVEAELECPVCYEVSRPPIYQCPEGHIICSACKPLLKACPQCDSKYTDPPIRCRFAEKLALKYFRDMERQETREEEEK